jgi:acyl-CoA thioester hydrolase
MFNFGTKIDNQTKIMFTSETQVRVRYSETDKMGYAYYGHYAAYFEVARVEALRQLGLSYREMEEKGIMLPVLDYRVKFFKPAFYDDVLLIKTRIEEMPTVRLRFVFETFSVEGSALNRAEVVLVFVDKEKNKPCPPPAYFMDKVRSYF